MVKLLPRRRRYFVAKKFQLKFAGMILLFMFMVALFSGITIYYYTWMTLGEKLANVYPQSRLVGILRHANFILFMRMLIITPFVFILTVVLSHRIAGPIYKIKSIIDGVVSGNRGKRISLRRTDELKDLADSINNLLDLLDKKK